MDIGKRVKEVMHYKGLTASWLAEQIPCERSNVYNIFRRNAMNVDLLRRLCVILEYDFFRDLSEELQKSNGATPTA